MFGICELSVLPVRKEASERSEMVTQLLFGETFYIIDINKNWASIKLITDQYEGWINVDSITKLNQAEFELINTSNSYVTKELLTDLRLISADELIKVPFGSTLPDFNENDSSFHIKDRKYQLKKANRNPLSIAELALQFLNSPYLWGGRNPLGIDCSGLTQVLYKTKGIYIPRDASEQVKSGTTVNFISDSQPGDLAFFDNNEGVITHVGIILNKTEIIHSSVKVRIDRIDQQGIYNRDLNKYTHKLRIIKRIT
jgi:hypothetical protein